MKVWHNMAGVKDIRDKKCNTIVVLKLDRLTRSVYDMEGIMKFLDENNAYLDCANEEINTTNSSGKMVVCNLFRTFAPR